MHWVKLLTPVLLDLQQGRTVFCHCLSARNRGPAFSSKKWPANGSSGERFGPLLGAGHPELSPCRSLRPGPVCGVASTGPGVWVPSTGPGIVGTQGLQRRLPSPKRPKPLVSDLPRTCRAWPSSVPTEASRQISKVRIPHSLLSFLILFFGSVGQGSLALGLI